MVAGLLLVINCSAQKLDKTNGSSQSLVYQFADVMPKPGFDMNEYLMQNLHYPMAARKKGTEGRVAIQFVVNEDGSISDVKVTRGIGSGCDEEAARVVQNMPNWKPGTVKGKPVKVMYTQPISFKLG